MKNYDVISQTPVAGEGEVFLDYFLGDTQEEAEKIYNEFSWRLNIMANSYSQWSGVDKADLFGEGLTGLARAVRDYDSERGTFLTFAIYKVKNALNECCRKNSSIVSIPAYIRTAHMYITNIKGILEACSLDPDDITKMLMGGYARTTADMMMVNGDFDRLDAEFNKLNTLARNSKVPYDNLIKNAEFIPSNVCFDESQSQEEMDERNKQLIAAALLVSKLEEHMTDLERQIANYIMEGKTYNEIGEVYDRSGVWVRLQLDEMKRRFRELLKED